MTLIASAVPAYAQDDSQNVIRDTEVENFLKVQTRPVLSAAGLDPDKVHYLLIASDDLNAFSTFHLIIGINTGTIMQADTPNQLFGVIAHETGHLAGGHPVRSGEMTRAGLKPMLLTMGLGVLAMALGAPDAGAALNDERTPVRVHRCPFLRLRFTPPEPMPG